MLGQFKQRTFASFKTTGQHSFFNQKNKKEGHDKCSKSSGEIRCQLAAFFPSCPVLMVGGGGGGDRTGSPSVFWSLSFFFFWDVPSSYCSFLWFFFIVLRCETVSPSGRSTHSVREKRVTFSSKTSSGNIKPCDQRKKNAQVLTYLSILFILQ